MSPARSHRLSASSNSGTAALELAVPAADHAAEEQAGGLGRQVLDLACELDAVVGRLARPLELAVHAVGEGEHARHRRLLDPVAEAAHLLDVARGIA